VNEKELMFVKRQEKYYNEKLNKFASEMAKERGYSLTAPIDWEKVKMFNLISEICLDLRDLQQL